MKRTGALLLVLLLLLAGLQYKLWYGHGGQADVVALNAQVLAQQSENGKLQARNDALAAEVTDLKTGGAAVEERARAELGMVKPGETFYRVIDHAAATQQQPSATSAPAADAAPAEEPVGDEVTDAPAAKVEPNP